LEGKVAVVTGAGSGIGRATAIMFAKEGAKVVATDYNEATGTETVQNIVENGGEAIFVKCNVRVQEEIKAMVRAAMDKYGRIDILFNCAGVLVHGPFLKHTYEDYRLISETNFLGYVWTMQEILPIMVNQGKGSVINVASISAVKPESNAYFYGAFKAGINKMTKDLAREFSPKGVRLNVICPGPINTNMTPDIVKHNKEIQEALIKSDVLVGRLGEPEDIAYCAVYLASDEAEFITGASFVVDGGSCVAGLNPLAEKEG